MKETLDTFPKLLKRNYEKYGNKKVAMRYKQFGIWKTYTYDDYYKKAKLFGLGIKSLGLEKGDKVCLIGDNAPEAFIAELGVQALSGVILGLYTDAVPSELKYLLEHSDTVFAVVDNQEQVDKLLEIKEELPRLKKIIYWDSKGLVHYDDPILVNIRKVYELGRQYEQEHQGIFERSIEEGKGDDLALLLYTSGTKGLPKGAMITYNNLLSAMDAVMQWDSWTEDSKSFSYLPLAWIPEHFFGIAGPLISGGSVNFPEDPETINSDIREIGPTQLFYGSRLWETLTSMMQARITESTFVKRLTYKILFPVGYKWTDLLLQGKKPNLFWRFAHALADLVLFGPIRDDMGLSHLQFGWSAGALLSPDSYRLILAIGIPIKNHYALTEVGAICNSGKEFKPETVGRPVPGVEIRISTEGEILARGDMVIKGYYKDPEKTGEAIEDGWFHTGDAGFFDDDGHLIFLDRLSDLVELAGGGKVAPQYLESSLRFSPYISDTMVLAGEDKPYVSAILVISFENVGRWAEMNKINYTTFTDLSQKKEVYDLIHKEMLRVNKTTTEGSAIKRFILMHKELDPDEAELTRTRKLRRDFIESRYGDMIQGIYSGQSEVPVEAEVRYRDGRTGVVKTSVKIMDVE